MASVGLPSATILPGNLTPEQPPNNVQHKRGRFFVGPMPEKVISKKKAQVRKTGRQQGFFRTFYPSSVTVHEDDEDDDVSQLVKAHAFDFFIQRGGKVEDWGKVEERVTIEAMVKRWRESEWGKILFNNKPQTRQVNRWVGGSFEIGSFLGMNIIHNEAVESVREGASNRSSSRKAKSSTDPSQVQSTPGPEPFTIETAVSPPTLQPDFHVDNHAAVTFLTREHNDTESQVAPSASSSTALLKSPLAPKSSALKPILRASSSLPAPLYGYQGTGDGTTRLPPMTKFSSKPVHYSEIPNGESQTLDPAPPEHVLKRRGSAIADTSAGATVPEHPRDDLRWGDVVMRDRMLVRVMCTKSESIGIPFDERQNRTMDKVQYEDWAEHLVIWRKDRLEIYRNYSLPWQELAMGHKDLAFIVPLKTSRTHLSMYSFVDLTFCITCPPIDIDTYKKKRGLGDHELQGTCIFVFKAKSRTRALDWTWELWRYLGGQIPSSLEIRSPSMDIRLKVELPQNFLSETHETFTRRNIIGLCSDTLRLVPDWNDVIQRRIADGSKLELAWRVETKLDWIWPDEGVDGSERHWAVLCGLALRQKDCTPYLEVRLTEHFPMTVYTKDGTQLREPPGIEGYLDRIKPNSQSRQPIYLATHDGNLFYLTPAYANPPSPPGFHASSEDATDDAPTLHQVEVQRGTIQIMNAIGVNDVRDILIVRRAFQNVPRPMHNEPIPKTDDSFAQMWTQSHPESSESDNEDEGGDQAILRSNNKTYLRVKRSFELLLKNGHIIRFEAYSRRVALEWIDRLRALIVYWRQRHHVDAREEMDLVRGSRSRLTPLTFACHGKHDPEGPPDLSAMSSLSSRYHWCVMDGCKPIIMGGKLHTRRGLYGPYRTVQLFLVSGQLVQYHVNPKYSLHERQSKVINLLDAYVCSGYFAARVLPKGQYNPNAPPTARRYQDGLETDDPEDDTIFTVLYRKKSPIVDTSLSSAGDGTALQERLHRLGASRKFVIFRTRSKLERDAWCWAMNCEIEKMVRMTKIREDRLRAQGGLAEL